MNTLPRLLITMGDVAGIGPEIIAGAWEQITNLCKPVVVGDLGWMEKAVCLRSPGTQVVLSNSVVEAEPMAGRIPVIQGTNEDLSGVPTGRVSAAAGQAAYDFLTRAVDLTMASQADGIVTAPIHKGGLQAAGIPFPGHTEILAAKTRTTRFGMLLFGHGISVIHVTLHVALRDVFALLSTGAIVEKIRLVHELLPRLTRRQPRIAVAGLNPHASDGGLFGSEELEIIQPAVEMSRREGINVIGPLPCDTLFVRARNGEFDGVVAMYHDQGHIALKLMAGHDAVNISVGLPLVRTSVSHGTAYDIAWRGIAGAGSLVEATRIAALLAG